MVITHMFPTDVDECVGDRTLCQPTGVCKNTEGGYTCECPEGYRVDGAGTGCVDVDECDDVEMCEYGCENVDGGYNCQCPVGFMKHNYWNQCVGECDNLPHVSRYNSMSRLLISY